jgi:hypothetical protein
MALITLAGVGAAMTMDAGGSLGSLIRRLVVFVVVVAIGAIPLLWLSRAAWLAPRPRGGGGAPGPAEVVPGGEIARGGDPLKITRLL